MFTSFRIPELKKELYYKLNSSLQVTSFDSQLKNYKFAGLYAIYKNDICLYVGQSKNLASRLSDHLSGKYAEADSIFLFYVNENGFGNFDSRTPSTQKTILETNELKLIELLKPIENIINPADEFNPSDDHLFNCFTDEFDGEQLIPNRINSVIYIGDYHIYACEAVICDDMSCEALSYHNDMVIHAHLIKEGK